jgi:hypothetical protein
MNVGCTDIQCVPVTMRGERPPEGQVPLAYRGKKRDGGLCTGLGLSWDLVVPRPQGKLGL